MSIRAIQRSVSFGEGAHMQHLQLRRQSHEATDNWHSIRFILGLNDTDFVESLTLVNNSAQSEMRVEISTMLQVSSLAISYCSSPPQSGPYGDVYSASGMCSIVQTPRLTPTPTAIKLCSIHNYTMQDVFAVRSSVSSSHETSAPFW
jgi:hypothetical protein